MTADVAREAGRRLRRRTLLAVAILAALAQAPVAEAGTDPIGAHSMLQVNSPPAFMRAMFGEAAAMHAASIRLDVAPALIFRDPAAPPDFSGLDEVVALSQQYHLRVVADLFTVPAWIASCQGQQTGAAASRCGTDDLAGYGDEIRQIVAHADPAIRDWEIWNEPDTSEFFTGTTQQYAWMLRTAHDVIKQVDPQDDVLLGGISGQSGMAWLAQVFATPGAQAAFAFDTANVHVRAALDSLAQTVGAWRWFLGAYHFTGPLWVTEHGYPSDPAYQYDPGYDTGPGAQAAYLEASIPTLLDAGASQVFVTERDDLGGQFASEGVLGGDVSDPPPADPQVVEKPAYAVVRSIADCYSQLGRDCPGRPPAATPGWDVVPGTRVGSTRTTTISVSNPGPKPLALAPAQLAGGGSTQLSVVGDGCPAILEPGQGCPVRVRFTPHAPGVLSATLDLVSDSGQLRVGVSAVAPSVSALASPQLPMARFAPEPGEGGVDGAQRIYVTFANRLLATVRISGTSLSGKDAGEFRLQQDACRATELDPGARCRLEILFVPERPGSARAELTLRGDGRPLVVPLRASARATLQRARRTR